MHFNLKDDIINAMDLFDLNINKNAPLADRMRPANLSDFIGQDHIVKNESVVKRAIKADRLGSCIFYGPPGVGKTTLAMVVVASTKAEHVRLNAVSSGVAEAKKIIDDARQRLKMYGKRTYLLLDECHRWNKAQSDSVLAAIEDGTIIFIGTTTENPNLSMTRAIVSRCRIFELKSLSNEDIKIGLRRASVDKEKGLGNYKLELSDEAVDFFAFAASGDLRNALNGLELAVLSTAPTKDGMIIIDLDVAISCMQKKSFSVSESTFFDMLSAFCKSLRGSDVDAALYWGFALLEAGCDPLILFRRMIAHASEDIGMADSGVLKFVVCCMDAYKNIGMPEGELTLAHAIIYVASAKKSCAVIEARVRVKNALSRNGEIFVPLHLRNNNHSTFEKSKIPYLYPHDFGGYIKQQYLPEGVVGNFYNPSENGDEKIIKEFLEDIKKNTK